MAGIYATQADIEAEFKALTFSASTNPTATQVVQFIEEEEEVVAASVGMKYALPITSASNPKAFKLIRKTVVELVAGRVKNIIAVKSGSQDANQGKVSDGDAMIKRAMDRLKLIRDGEIKLVDATLASSSDGVSSFNVANEEQYTESLDDTYDPMSSGYGNPAASVPAFRRGKKLW